MNKNNNNDEDDNGDDNNNNNSDDDDNNNNKIPVCRQKSKLSRQRFKRLLVLSLIELVKDVETAQSTVGSTLGNGWSFWQHVIVGVLTLVQH